MDFELCAHTLLNETKIETDKTKETIKHTEDTPKTLYASHRWHKIRFNALNEMKAKERIREMTTTNGDDEQKKNVQKTDNNKTASRSQ